MTKFSQRVLGLLSLGALAAAASFALVARLPAAELAHKIPAPAQDQKPSGTSETVVLAGGCFWGVQGVFQHVKGVTSAVSGYDGGKASTAHYEMTSRGDTGHAESVRVTFDPQKISYGRILQIYFSVAHNPTERDHQGPDWGTQYRSAIFPANEAQARIAAAYIRQLDRAHVFREPIVTQIEPGKTFYPAEGYHQNFLALHPRNPYIVINDLPKLHNLKRLFPAYYRADPVLVRTGRS